MFREIDNMQNPEETIPKSDIAKRRRFDSVALMRLIDKTVGSFTCYLLSLFKRKQNKPPEEIKKILLIKFFGFGNLIMLSPVFRQLKQRYPDAELVFLTLSGNRKLLSQYKALSKIIGIDLSNPLLLPFRILHAAYELRKESVDVAIDFEQYSRTSAVLSFLGGRNFGIGFSIQNNPRHLMFDATVECSEKEPVVMQSQRLLAALDADEIRSEKIRLEKIEYSQEDAAFVDTLLDAQGSLSKAQSIQHSAFSIQPKANRFVVLHVGNGSNAPEKRWAIENYVELANRLAKGGLKTAIIGSNQDQAEVEQFKARFAWDYLDLFNKLSIPQLAYLLTRASAYVSADTGPAHLAAAMDTPAVVIYGPSNPTVYGAWGTNVHYIYKNLWCSPCGSVLNSHEYICINKVYQKCMKDISVDEVEKKVLEIMR